MTAETIGIGVGAILTLLVFSYLIGDTPVFRLAQAIFVGVAIGYATTVAVYLVLLPKLVYPLVEQFADYWHLLVPLVLGLLLLTKVRTTWAPFGNVSIAFLFGVGGALAIGGALGGALLPQLEATVVSLSPALGWDAANNLLLAFGTIGALLSFRFMTNLNRPAGRTLEGLARGWSYFGRWFILVAFGAIFATTAVSRVSVLIGRVDYMSNMVRVLLTGAP